MAHCFGGKPEAERDLARLKRLQTHCRVNRFAQDGVRVLLGNFFDLHAPRGAGHEGGAAARAVHEQAEVEFALDVEALLDEQPADNSPAGAGLRRDQLHAQHPGGDVRRFLGGARQFDAAGFAAPARVNLRFDDDHRSFEALGAFPGFVLGECDFAARRGDAVAR